MNTVPDPDTLARLAAQARFANLSAGEAARAALKLWQECQAVLEDAERSRHRAELGVPTPQPSHWPATLENDFYRLIVRAKDKTHNQPRFKRFLRFQVQDRVNRLLEELAKVEFFKKRLVADYGPESAWPDCYKERYSKSEKEMTEFVGRKFGYISTDHSPEAIDKEVDRLFVKYKTEPFSPETWCNPALDYLRWWEQESTQNKRSAGKARAAKAAAERKAAVIPKLIRRRKKSPPAS